MRRKWCVLLATALASVAVMSVGACGAKDSGHRVASLGKSTPPSSDRQAGSDRFEKCMKDNGVAPQEVAGGQADGGSGVVTEAPAPDTQGKRQEALDKCRQYLPNGGNPQPMSTEQLEQARAVAKCMRAAGVNYPDPDPNTGGGRGAEPIPDGVDIGDPTVLAKLRDCEQRVGAGGPGVAATGTPGAK